MVTKQIAPIMKIPNLRTGQIERRPTYAPLTNVASNIKSNNYNFEEEWLLGGDRIITRQYENNCYRERIEFKTEEVDKEYYFIEYYEFDTRPDSPNFDAIQDRNILHIDLHNKINDTFPTGEAKVVQRYKLYQKNADDEDEFISMREVKKDIDPNTNRVRTTEVISHFDPNPPVVSNVLFENGKWNKRFMLSGFNFDNKIKVIGDYEQDSDGKDFQNKVMNNFKKGGFAQYYDTPTCFEVYGCQLADSYNFGFQILDGELKRNAPKPSNYSDLGMNGYATGLIIPIRIPSGLTRLKAEIKQHNCYGTDTSYQGPCLELYKLGDENKMVQVCGSKAAEPIRETDKDYYITKTYSGYDGLPADTSSIKYLLISCADFEEGYIRKIQFEK